jgi:hypothetical protein
VFLSDFNEFCTVDTVLCPSGKHIIIFVSRTISFSTIIDDDDDDDRKE